MLDTHLDCRDNRAAAAVTHDPVGDYAAVRQAIEFITAEWREQPELAAIASHLGISPAHCQRLFKRWCGVSPKEFVQAITVDHARGLLEGAASVLDTSLAVGLSGPGRLHDLFIDHEAMTPGEYKQRGAGLKISYGFHPSRFGLALLMTTRRGICGLAFADDADGKEAVLADMTRRWPAARYVEDSAGTTPAAQAIFGASGAEQVRLVLIGTDFEVRVWTALTHIPAGTLTTYGMLASQMGVPKAARAVGAAIGRNPISFVVPCHRVVGANGSLTGYHWGITRKRALIGWERLQR